MQLGEPLHKTGGRDFDSRWGHRNFSSDLILLFAFSTPGVHSASNRNKYQGICLGVKATLCFVHTSVSWLCL